jgi:hypothetical protein
MNKRFALIGILSTLFAGSASATYFTAEYVGAGGYLSSAPKTSGPAGPTLAPGLYVSVTTGQIVVSNPAGSLDLTAGQFGFTPSANAPTVLLPKSNGLQFTTPPVFNNTTVQGPASNTANRSNAVDCEVR